MSRKNSQRMILKYNIAELEKEAAVICQDFETFCNYILENQIKLAKGSGNIGKKDCFALNSLFRVKKDCEKPTHIQSKYPIINFFYYVAVKFRILQINVSGTALQQGEYFEIFQKASIWEQYLLFLVTFLSEGTYTIQEGYLGGNRIADIWKWYIDGVMEFFLEEKFCNGARCRLTKDSELRGFFELDVVIPYLEELNLIHVWNRPAIGSREEEYWWGIEVLPLMEVVLDLYENVMLDEADIISNEILTQRSYELCVEQLVSKQEESGLVKLFEEPKEKSRKEIIDLKVTVRHTACVRVIRMNVSNTLEDLHEMIQEAVEFDNDHLYEFTIGKGMLKRTYLSPYARTSGDELSVTDASLNSLNLSKGQIFSYLFDFGDMWWFDIEVLDIQEGTVKKPEIIRVINEAPMQYPFNEEEAEGWCPEITEQVSVSSILSTVEDELIKAEYTALIGFKEEIQEKTIDEIRLEIERILFEKPDRILAFMTEEMRSVLKELLQGEWIGSNEYCTLIKLYSLGFCMPPEEDEDVILVPKAVKDVYVKKTKSAGKYDKIADTTEVFLRRCGVMETEKLYAAVVGFLKSKSSYSDFEFVIYGRLQYYGEYYSDCFDAKEYMSCYNREMTEQILAERQKFENVSYEYPDFERLYSKGIKELPAAQIRWSEYIDFNLNIDWRAARELIVEIPAMAASGIIECDEIISVYREMIRCAGGRTSRKAEKLIRELCETMPLATRKGNTEESVLLNGKLSQVTAEEKKDNTTKIADKQEYIQLSIFDL